jgi:hypothetical protein
MRDIDEIARCGLLDHPDPKIGYPTQVTVDGDEYRALCATVLTRGLLVTALSHKGTARIHQHTAPDGSLVFDIESQQ